MALTDLLATVVGSPVQPPVYGLLAAAPPSAGLDEAWVEGMRWAPEAPVSASTSGVLAVSCDMGSMGGADAASFATTDAFLVWASDTCSATGFRAHDYAGRARRALAAAESYQVAYQFWTDALALGSSRGLADSASDELTTSAVTPAVALALLEQGIATKGYGRRGMIHCTPQVLTGFVEGVGLTWRNGLWLTPMGNIVVADAGYPGTAPTTPTTTPTTTQWAYATEIVEVVMTPVQVVPDIDPATDPGGFMRNGALGRTVDKVVTYAWRLAAVKWDQQIHIAAEVNVAWPTFGGS